MINFNELNEYMDNDEAVIKEFLIEFKNQYSNFFNDISNHLNNKQWKEIFMLLHALRGAASLFCKGEFIELLERLETEVNINSFISADEISSLNKHLQVLNSEINVYINS